MQGAFIYSGKAQHGAWDCGKSAGASAEGQCHKYVLIYFKIGIWKHSFFYFINIIINNIFVSNRWFKNRSFFYNFAHLCFFFCFVVINNSGQLIVWLFYVKFISELHQKQFLRMYFVQLYQHQGLVIHSKYSLRKTC